METHFWPWLTIKSWEAKSDASAVLLSTKQSWSHSRLHGVCSLFVWPSRGPSLALPHFGSWRTYLLEKSSDAFFFFSFWADELEERLIAFLTAPITDHFLPSASIQDDTNKLKNLSFADLLVCFYATSNIQESSRSRELVQVLLC